MVFWKSEIVFKKNLVANPSAIKNITSIKVKYFGLKLTGFGDTEIRTVSSN